MQRIRHILLATALAAGVGTVPLAQAQSAGAADTSGTRIGFVNTDRIFSEATAAQKAQALLKQEFSGREAALTAQGKKLQAAIDKFGKESASLTPEQRAKREQELMAQDMDFQQKRREFQEDLNNRKNEELQKLLDRANRVVIQVAKSENIDLVLQEAVYVNGKLDITDKVLKALNAGQ